MKLLRFLTSLLALLTCVLSVVAQDLAQKGGAAANTQQTASFTADKKTELSQVRREIEETNRRMVETFKSGDLLGVSGFYAADATIFYSRGKKIHGRAAIDAYWTSLKGGKDWKLEVLEVGGEKETVYQIGKSSFTSVIDGQESTYVCDFLLIWKRQPGGGYKIHVDIYN